MHYYKTGVALIFFSMVGSVFATPAPESFVIDEGGDTRISFDWQDVESAEGYYIYYGTKSGVDQAYEVEGIDLIEKSEFVLSNLSPDTNYYVAVTAIDEFGKESEFSQELVYQTSSLGSASVNTSTFKIVDVEVIDKNTLELSFSVNLDTNASASRSFIIEDSVMGIELEVDMSQVREGNTQNVVVILGVDMDPGTDYKVTVLELRDTFGNTIESGIDAFINFSTPLSFENVSLDAAPEAILQEVVQPTPVIIPEPKTVVAPETKKPKAQEMENKVEISQLNSSQDTNSNTQAGVTLSDSELPKDQITKAAIQTEKLPKTGPELWLLLACIALFTGALTLIAKNKKTL